MTEANAGTGAETDAGTGASGDDGPHYVTGDLLGVAFPTTIEPFLADAPAFLTRGFRAAGSIAPDNAVVAVDNPTEFYGGGMGRKLIVDVRYARDEPGLHSRLFFKFPRMFGDPLREMFGVLMEPEVRFALLSRRDDFPVPVARCYFADYNAETVTGLLITECIPYGTGTIEPAHDKCLDYQIADLDGHYQALVCALGTLAGTHRSGRFGGEVDENFPFDPDVVDTGARIPYDAEQLAEKIGLLKDFAAKAPQLLPRGLADEAFLDSFGHEARRVLDCEDGIRRYLNTQSDYVALCHWNLNIDNAWFWRDETGLHAGLLDWGSVAQMNLGGALYGVVCASEADFVESAMPALIDLFARTYRDSGGPDIATDVLGRMFDLSIAVLGIAWILDAPTIIAREVPDFAAAGDRTDPRLAGNFLARAQLQLLVVFLSLWRSRKVGRALQEFATPD
jgi:hypothetical protein